MNFNFNGIDKKFKDLLKNPVYESIGITLIFPNKITWYFTRNEGIVTWDTTYLQEGTVQEFELAVRRYVALCKKTIPEIWGKRLSAKQKGVKNEKKTEEYFRNLGVQEKHIWTVTKTRFGGMDLFGLFDHVFVLPIGTLAIGPNEKYPMMVFVQTKTNNKHGKKAWFDQCRETMLGLEAYCMYFNWIDGQEEPDISTLVLEIVR